MRKQILEGVSKLEDISHINMNKNDIFIYYFLKVSKQIRQVYIEARQCLK